MTTIDTYRVAVPKRAYATLKLSHPASVIEVHNPSDHPIQVRFGGAKTHWYTIDPLCTFDNQLGQAISFITIRRCGPRVGDAKAWVMTTLS